MKDAKGPEPVTQSCGLIDSSKKFEAKRASVLADEAAEIAKSNGLPQLRTRPTISKEEFVKNGIRNSERALKDRLRVPVFIVLGIWSLLAAYINFEKDAFGVFIMIGFLFLSGALVADAIDWARLFRDYEQAKKENLRRLDE